MSDNTPCLATRLDVAADAAMPAASFVIIRRLALTIRTGTDMKIKRDVSMHFCESFIYGFPI